MKWCKSCNSTHDAKAVVCPKDGSFLVQMQENQIDEELPQLKTVIGDHYELVAGPIRGSKRGVYKARHLLVDRTVIIKILLPELKHLGDVVQRFQNETKMMAMIAHPGVAHSLDMGLTPANNPYQVGEFCEGSTLDQLLRADEIETAELITVFNQLCHALDAVHKQKIVHLALKPNHIMVHFPAKNQVVTYLLDFYQSEEIGYQTQNAVDIPALFRNCGFPSPELLKGEKLDQRADVYSLGCVLFKALTGKAVFTGTDAKELARMHIEDKPKQLHQAAPGKSFPAVLNNCVMTALEKDPANRYQNMLDMQRDLMMIAPSLL